VTMRKALICMLVVALIGVSAFTGDDDDEGYGAEWGQNGKGKGHGRKGKGSYGGYDEGPLGDFDLDEGPFGDPFGGNGPAHGFKGKSHHGHGKKGHNFHRTKAPTAIYREEVPVYVNQKQEQPLSYKWPQASTGPAGPAPILLQAQRPAYQKKTNSATSGYTQQQVQFPQQQQQAFLDQSQPYIMQQQQQQQPAYMQTQNSAIAGTSGVFRGNSDYFGNLTPDEQHFINPNSQQPFNAQIAPQFDQSRNQFQELPRLQSPAQFQQNFQPIPFNAQQQFQQQAINQMTGLSI